MQTASQSVSDETAAQTGRLVARNTIYLTVSQVLTVPLSIVTSAMAGRYLGAELFGFGYLAGTLCAFGFLTVGWGQDSVLPAVVARDHKVSGTVLASSLAWRAAASVVVYLALAAACFALGYPAELQWALALSALFNALTYFVAACKDTIRGLERTDIPAYAHVGQQILAAVFVAIPCRSEANSAPVYWCKVSPPSSRWRRC